MQRNKKRINKTNREQNSFITALTGGGIGLGCTAVLSLISPLILLKAPDPKQFITIAAAVCIFTGGAVSGIFCGMRQKDSPVITSLISGALMVLPMAVLSLFIKGGFDLLSAAINCICALSSSVLSAFLLNRSSKNNGKKMKKLLKNR